MRCWQQRLHADSAQSWPHNRLLLTINRSSSISKFKLKIVEFGSVLHFELSMEHWKVKVQCFWSNLLHPFPWYYRDHCPNTHGIPVHCIPIPVVLPQPLSPQPRIYLGYRRFPAVAITIQLSRLSSSSVSATSMQFYTTIVYRNLNYLHSVPLRYTLN